ncbi:MAG: hypothetical protein LUD00_01655 [Prevotellaceae bacterium]|nr:hypothetical protein [Prevotellaceae bacterium]
MEALPAGFRNMREPGFVGVWTDNGIHLYALYGIGAAAANAVCSRAAMGIFGMKIKRIDKNG